MFYCLRNTNKQLTHHNIGCMVRSQEIVRLLPPPSLLPPIQGLIISSGCPGNSLCRQTIHRDQPSDGVKGYVLLWPDVVPL